MTFAGTCWEINFLMFFVNSPPPYPFCPFIPVRCNLPPVFTQDMNNEAFPESTPVGTVVYKLAGYDPEGGNVTFGLIDSGNFMVDPVSGEVRIVKALDYEVSSCCETWLPCHLINRMAI